MNLCVIPARGGSKRIPKKNIKNFYGKPLIAYSIETAKRSGLFETVVVSTDAKEIAEIAKEYGAEILYRPKELADDFTPSIDVFEHAIELLSQKKRYEYGCMIYPTAPLLQVKYLQEGLKRLQASDACFAFSATSYDFPIWRGFEIVDGKAKMFFPKYMATRSQDLKEAYHDAAQFYWKKLKCQEKFHFDGSVPILIPRYLVQDIDTLEDFHRAELMYRVLCEYYTS